MGAIGEVGSVIGVMVGDGAGAGGGGDGGGGSCLCRCRLVNCRRRISRSRASLCVRNVRGVHDEIVTTTTGEGVEVGDGGDGVVCAGDGEGGLLDRWRRIR